MTAAATKQQRKVLVALSLSGVADHYCAAAAAAAANLLPLPSLSRLLIVLQVDNDNPTFPYHQMIGNPQPVPDGTDAGAAMLLLWAPFWWA